MTASTPTAPAAPTGPAPLTPVLTRRWASPRSWSIDTYRQLDGYQALPMALGRRTGPGHRADQELRPARPRRRRLPDRPEVVVPAAGQHQAQLPGDQR